MHSPAQSTLVPVSFVVLGAIGVGASTVAQAPMVTALIAAFAASAAIMAVAGLDGLGMTVLGVSFFMAPFFRAFPIVPGTAISAIDPLLVLSIFLLLPRILRGRLDVSTSYLSSALAFIAIGCVASLASPDPSNGLVEIVHWAFLAVVMAFAFIALDLSRLEIASFAAIYVAGQMLSSAVAIVNGPLPENNRYEGLAAHPNYFADGAMMAACLLLYLYHEPRARGPLMRGVWWAAMAVCLIGIYISGSRGPALGMAMVFVLVPIVERTSIAVFLGTVTLVGGAVIAQPLAQNAGEGSTLARLTGSDGTGTLTGDFRKRSWGEAFDQIAASPIFGNGLSLEVLSYHNNYLSIAAGLGVFALAAYLIVLWSLTRGLFGPSPERRLLYPMVAFAMFSLTEPGFKDRSNWLPMLLGIAVFHGYKVAARSLKPTEFPHLDDYSSPPDRRFTRR